MRKCKLLSLIAIIAMSAGFSLSCNNDSESDLVITKPNPKPDKVSDDQDTEKNTDDNANDNDDDDNVNPSEDKTTEPEDKTDPPKPEDKTDPTEPEDKTDPANPDDTEPKPELPKDPGPQAEDEIQTDDSDVLEGFSLPQPKAISTSPCMACTNVQECINDNQCSNSTRHNVSVNKAFTAENGETAVFSISLTKKPTADVTFECWIESTSPYPEAKIDCSDTIPAGDWIQGQFSSATSNKYITVTGLPDDVDDGDQKYLVMLKTVSQDPYFSNITHSPMEFTNRNVNTAGVIWKADQSLVTSEGKQTATYTLSLQSKPQAPVKLKLRSSDITEGTVEPKTIVFTPETWNVPQPVTVTGVDDEYADGSVSYSILTTAVSIDPKYNGLAIEEVKLINLDNDTPGITISTSSYKLKPSSTTTTANVVLSTQPSEDVIIDMSSVSELIEVTPTELVIERDHWNEPHSFQLTFVNIEKAQNAITTYCTKAFATSDDEKYNDLVSNRRCIDLYRYDPMDFKSEDKEASITLVPGEYKLQVWGAQGGGSLNSLGGYGGYSYGTVTFNEVTDLFINVGGVPYNGGGPAQANGGGATHIAKVSGLLSTLSEKRDEVLIVAGGGGGSERNPGGYGGGLIGGDGNTYTYVTKIPTGATQEAGGERGETSMYGVGSAGTFGQGGDGIGQIDYVNNPNPHLDSGGGGGGGWYGGGGVPYAGGGGGGSGHIGTGVTGETLPGSGEVSFESPTGGLELGHAGTGYARISIIERDEPEVN